MSLIFVCQPIGLLSFAVSNPTPSAVKSFELEAMENNVYLIVR